MSTARFILVIAGDLGDTFGDCHEEGQPTRKAAVRRALLWHADFPQATITLEDLATGEETQLHPKGDYNDYTCNE